MTYASLLVAVEDGPQSDSRLELACDLALAYDARLVGLCVGSITPPVYDPIAAGAMAGELLTLYRDMAEADVKRAREGFEAKTGAREVKAEWREQIGYPADVFSAESRAADVIILGGRNPKAPYHAPQVADVLMASGRPVLVAPPDRLRSPVGEHVLIAWKDTRETRRALAASVPLLQRASGVSVYAVCANEEREQAVRAEMDDVVRYLAGHGVTAAPLLARKLDTTVGEQILHEALARDAGLIVAGGYGHARLREWVLGGVTQDLLDASSVCLFLAH